MKTIAIITLVGVSIAALFAVSSRPSSAIETEFRNFLDTYRNGYGTTEEYSYRLGVFAENLNRIAELNRRNPKATFSVNKFADRTPEEMKKLMGFIQRSPVNIKFTAATEVPDVDWTNMWESVKDQGQCGSCWAFSATAAFEARYALNNGQRTVTTLYSEQELVDCDPQSGGCGGGLMDYAFQYLQENGFCTEDQYPYNAYDDDCRAEICGSGPHDSSFYDIQMGNEQEVLGNLKNGPVSVAVDASSWSFYSEGVMTDCGSDIDHGVTLVASSSEGWVRIRNSWGEGWGESGHIRLATGSDTCGYTSAASFPTF